MTDSKHTITGSNADTTHTQHPPAPAAHQYAHPVQTPVVALARRAIAARDALAAGEISQTELYTALGDIAREANEYSLHYLTAAQVSQETREALWEEFDQAQREDWLVARADFSRECKSVFHAIVLNGSDTPPADKRNANDSIDKMLDRVDKMIDSVDKMLAAAEHLIETADACHDVYMSLYSAAPAPAPYRPPARRRSRLPYADDDDDEHDIFDN